jgi:enediyne biosynthesis protein E5
MFGRSHIAASPPVRFDPRLYQIAVLAGLLAYGLFVLRFDLGIGQAVVTLAAALGTQRLCSRLARIPFDPKSALISGLSLCLLLRTESPFVAMAAAASAIASKFALRWRGKHVWNPTNLAVVVMLILGWGWLSPGQWGSAAWFAFLTACLGTLVVTRAARADVTLAFLAGHAAIAFAVAAYLGQPAAVAIHRLQNGALLLFAFFMISDPRTTPDSRRGRVVFAILVAAAAAFVQYRLFRPNGPMWALAAAAPLTPLLDRWLPGERHSWTRKGARPDTLPRGDCHEPIPIPPAGAAGAARPAVAAAGRP